MDQLPHRRFPAGFVWIGPVRDIAVEIFRDRDLRREGAPALRHLDILLLEDHLPAVVGDLSVAPFPVHLIERRAVRIAEHAFEPEALAFLFRAPITRADRL